MFDKLERKLQFVNTFYDAQPVQDRYVPLMGFKMNRKSDKDVEKFLNT